MEVSFVISNLCNIWRYLHWQLVTSPTGNLSEVTTANCAQIFFLKYQLLYIRSALFCVSVNLIQHASCNFSIFFFIRHHTQSFIKSIFIHIYSKSEIYKSINYSLLHHHTSCFTKTLPYHKCLIKINSLIVV